MFDAAPRTSRDTRIPENLFRPDQMVALELKRRETEQENSLSLKPFVDLYGMEAIQSDYSKIAAKLKRYEAGDHSQSERLGHVFEAAVIDIGQKHGWFGKNSEITHTSKFDDFEHGVDMVTTMQPEDQQAQHVVTASDLTFSQGSAAGKFNRILNGVYGNKGAHMKYFHSEMQGFTGQLTGIPRTVIALDSSNLKTMLTRWMVEPELAQRQAALLILTQIQSQSRAFYNVARHKNGHETALARKYKLIEQTLTTLIESEYTGINAPKDRITDAIVSMSDRIRLEYRKG